VGLPEENTEDGIKVYGETSYENQIAVMSHYLHNKKEKISDDEKKEIILAIREFLARKISKQESFEELTDDQIWIAAESPMQYSLFDDFFKVPFPSPQAPKFTFIDLFAGIGGFRIAMQNLGGKCVYSSEFDAQAQKTYLENYGEMPFGDITKESTKQYIPDGFDILCAGFPCQAFSLAGKRRGFEETRGTLFFDVAEIIRRKRPKAFFLENVKGLKIHDKGKTLDTILNVLRNDLDYYVPDPEIVNAMNFGVPQHRERIYIVGFRKDMGVNEFTYPKPTDTTKRFIDIREENEVSAKYYLSTQYQHTLYEHKKRHESKGNGFGYEIIPDDGIANAIVVGGMGRERNIVIDNRLSDYTPVTHIKGEINHDGWRRMTPREWARLQGFPDSFIIAVADASAYKQFGNSVAVPAIQATAEQIVKRLKLNK
jgi:DNA (cytosine-5)-methyltransferase 1